ncbi:DUF2845 domain-containing protein [Legionella sp. km772]|uniref:DUF2845 domain-containing protein n=1 Tax=Legionella sp. km772 TaxID=2498111 RepID=UPI000F8EADE1|nr:DUF2845 domain-containing protein [Legionella sp. km772]RUR09165.1 DUF2845 domain-containing protein [Legionella sp. km772]
MNTKFILGLFTLTAPFTVIADQSYYCPENHGYINLGMTPAQVMAACGQPLSQQESKEPIYQKIPVQQLFYNNQGTSSAFYGVWNVSTGNNGAQLQVDVLNNKVQAIKVNGSDSNAFSICRGANIQVGDPVGKVYSACGNPSITNSTYTNVPIQSAQKPVIWTYKPSQYQPSITLTFVDGKLQSINN